MAQRNEAFLLAGRALSGVRTATQTVVGGISDPRDPTGGGNRTLVSNSSRVGFLSQFQTGVSDIMAGRISLLMLDTLIILMLAFYIWTHKAQGGG